MLKFWIIIFCITVLVGPLKAQQSKIDSIRKIIADTGTDTAKVRQYDLLSYVYRDNLKVDSCIWARRQALALNIKTHYSSQLECWEYAGIDYMLYETANYTESLKYAIRHLELSEKINDTMHKGLAHLVFGHDYKELGCYRKSLDHYFKAYNFWKLYYHYRYEYEDNTYTILCISQVYLKMKLLDSAMLYASKAFNIATSRSDGGYILLATRVLGDIYFAQGDDETAFKYYRQYVPDYVKYKEINRDLGFVLLNIAKVFQKKNQIDSAVYYAKKSLENAQKYNDQENLFNASILLSEYYKDKDDHKALTYLRIANQARDSMLTADKQRQIQILLFNEQIKEKEKADADAKEAARIRLTIIISAVMMSLISFLLWNRIRQLRLRYKAILEQKEAEKLKAKYEKDLLELEAKALRAQMNPHFIFNCMNSIKALIHQHQEEKSIIYLTTFSKLIRTLFQNSDKRQISLHDEMETCQLYIRLEAMRFNEKLEYNFDIDPNIDLKSVMVPALIIQPFIENAIWHGIVPKDKGRINVSIKEVDESIVCEIEDDGIGRDMSRLNKPVTQVIHESKGVRLSQTRLNIERMLNETQANIDIIDKYENTRSTGTKVVVTFNLN